MPQKQVKKRVAKAVVFNTTEIIHTEMVQPCKKCKFCPYGFLVEEYRVREKPNKYTCTYFGHDCPAWYLAEFLIKD